MNLGFGPGNKVANLVNLQKKDLVTRRSLELDHGIRIDIWDFHPIEFCVIEMLGSVGIKYFSDWW